MIFKAWCRHHIGGPYGSLIAVAMLNLIIITVLGEVNRNAERSCILQNFQ